MKKSLLPLVCLLTGCLFSCDDDTPDLNSQYLIVDARDGYGNIARYDFESKTFTDRVFVLDPASGSAVFNDVVIEGDHAYAVTGYGFNHLRKIDIKTGTDIKRVDSTPVRSLIDLYDDKILVSAVDYDVEENTTYACIKIYDQDLVLLDSIVDWNVIEIYDTEVVGNKLFLSTPAPDHTGLIKVVDLKSFAFTPPVETSSPGYQLIKASNKQLLAVRNDNVYTINTVSLKVERETPVFLSLTLGRFFCAYNAKDNVLYYLHPNPQPSYPAVRLFSLNLSTGNAEPVMEFSEGVGSPIAYDDKMGVILTGGGGLKIFSKDGKELDEVSVSLNTLKIFIQ